MELERGVPFEPRQELTVHYKGQPLKKTYCADLICYGAVIVELKALDRLGGKEESQILN